jgi:hypothetical protein
MISSEAVFADGPLAFELTTDFYGKYIWRGQNLSDDPVFQPGLSAAAGPLTASIWGNMDMTNINGNAGDFSEVDYSLDYSGSLPDAESIGYSIGVIYYDFPGTSVPDTTEIYGGLSLDVPLSPSVTLYRDVDEAEGTYVSLGIGHSIEKIAELAPDMPLGMDLGASLGWGSSSYNKYYWGPDNSELNDLVLSASFPVALGDLTVSPSLNYVKLVDSDIRSADAYASSSDYFFAGISLSLSF